MPAGSSQGEPTVDLHGLRVEEARLRVARFLVAEQVRGTVSVSIVTGNGTGAVKRAVRDLLNQHPAVSSWRPALNQDARTLVVLRAARR